MTDDIPVTTLRDLAPAECDVSGHGWEIERYVDLLSPKTGEVRMAAVAWMRCWRCNARTEVPSA